MDYSKHATKRMKLRGIDQADADAILANPDKSAEGDDGATNYRLRPLRISGPSNRGARWRHHQDGRVGRLPEKEKSR